MQSLKSIRPAEVGNFFKQSFEQKKLIPLYDCYIRQLRTSKSKLSLGHQQKFAGRSAEVPFYSWKTFRASKLPIAWCDLYFFP